MSNPAPMPDAIVPDALRYWERRRLPYNMALTALAAAWVVLTWPHFRSAFTLDALGKLLVLAVLANVCYSSAYLIDLPLQGTSVGDAWRRHRWMLWTLGTLFALVFEYYWIGDEIYPSVR